MATRTGDGHQCSHILFLEGRFCPPCPQLNLPMEGQSINPLAACKSEAGKPYKSSPQKAKLQTYHPLCWRIRRLRFLSASRLAQIRQASEQYAWLVVGRYSFPHTGHFFWRWEVSFPVSIASSDGSTGSTDRSKYRQRPPVHHL